MSLVGQSILMALTVTVNKFASSNVQSVQRRQRSQTSTNNKATRRRELLLCTLNVLAASQVSDSKTELLQKYLKKSKENKSKNDKERLDSYYKRNYKDYFELEQGSFRNKEQLSKTEKGILDWLQSNK